MRRHVAHRRAILILFLAFSGAPLVLHAQSVSGTVGAGVPESGSQSLSNSLALASVEPSSGVLRTSLPLTLPAARNGVQPYLSIGYNSAAGGREIGVGWGLSMPVIERRNLWGAPQYQDFPNTGAINVALMDRFTYDGAPLVPLCVVTNGVCPQQPAEPMPAWTANDPWIYFRLEREGSFARFFWSPNRMTWRIQMKGGQILELGVPWLVLTEPGDPGEHGIDFDDVMDCTPFPAPGRVAGTCLGVRHPYRWRMVRQWDTESTGGIPENLVVYRWKSFGRTPLTYLTDVYYGRPAQRTNERVSPEATFAHHVHVSWERGFDVVSSIVPAWKASPDMRIARIDVTSAPAARPAPRELVRRFHLSYIRQASRSYLTRFQLEGRCAAALAEANGQLPETACPRFPPTVLAYSGESLNTIGTSIIKRAGFDFPLRPGAKALSLALLDVNADSLPDLIEIDEPVPTNKHRAYLDDGIFMAEVDILGDPKLFTTPANTVVGDLIGSGHTGAVWIAGAQSIVADASDVSGTLSWETTAANVFASVKLTGDVNGDGMVDVVDWADALAADGSVTTYFTTRDSKFTHPLAATTKSCVGPSGQKQAEFDWPDTTRRPALADMNGDGLPDLIFVGPHALSYWPGDGRGNFGTCSGASCACSVGPFETPSTPMFSPDLSGSASSRVFLQDLNGDGFADILSISGDGLRIYFNFEGWKFQDPLFVAGSSISEFYKASADWDTLRVGFADMNGNGITDIVFFIGGAVHALDLHRIINIAQVFAPDAWAPRPGLLIQIDNGIGASTKISYISTADLARTALITGKRWKRPMPQVMAIVGRVTYTNAMPGTDAIRVAYDYDKPAWDGWERGFLGFETVNIVRLASPGQSEPPLKVDETFSMPICTGVCPPGLFTTAALADAMAGLPLVTEIADYNGLSFSQTARGYQVEELYTGLDGRRVIFPYSDRTDTMLYDTAAFAPGTGSGGITATIRGRETAVRSLYIPARARDALIRTTQTRDGFGNVTKRIDHGRIQDNGDPIDQPIELTFTLAAPRSDWKFLVKTIETAPFAHRTGVPDDALRRRRMEYDAGGRLKAVFAGLNGTVPLDRRHESAAATAPAPPGASVDGDVRLSLFDYDQYGNVVRLEEPNGRCTTTVFDPLFAEFPISTHVTTRGCAATDKLVTVRTWDRGLQAVVSTSNAAKATGRIEYDGFGRLVATYPPAPATGQPAPDRGIDVTYFDAQGGPVQRVRTVARTAPGQSRTAWSYWDGDGRLVLTLEQADPSAGDAGAWVAEGLPELGAAREVRLLHNPWFYSGDPAVHPLAPPSTPATKITRDAFGRVLDVIGPDGASAGRRAYHALAVDFTDAGGRLTRLALDGHGRLISSERRNGGDRLVTSIDFLVNGEQARIVRSHAGGAGQQTRWLQYDSMGRLVVNAEPNSATGFDSDPVASPAMKSWRYAYNDNGDLVGTSDARGCGKNLIYDGAGRQLAEDYSPCLSSQGPYTPFNPATGAGAEGLFVYDAPEAGQTGDFGVSASNLRGRLVAVRDRAAHTRYAYDARGRVTGIARQVSRPAAPNGVYDLVNPYAADWFRRTAVYDDADRLVRSSTGASAAGLLDSSGASDVVFAYNKRGFPTSIGGSYGTLLAFEARDADNAPIVRRFGDVASTTATFTYDALHRLKQYRLARSPAALWTAGAPGYVRSAAGDPPTMQTVLEDLTFTFDAADNPSLVVDARPPADWPAGAKPVSRTLHYDDLDRLTAIEYAHAGGSDAAVAFAAAGDRPSVGALVDRVNAQTFAFDWLDNTVATTDDASLVYDRSLGTITNGTAARGPHQLTAAGGLISAAYDAAGNLSALRVDRAAPCSESGGRCALRFIYDWDEVGRLARARRWDEIAASAPGPVDGTVPAAAPDADLRYRYEATGVRLLRSAFVGSQAVHTVDVFSSLRLASTSFDAGTAAYVRSGDAEEVSVAGLARVVTRTGLPEAGISSRHVMLELGDHLGSTTTVIDKATGELVERLAYEAYGSPDSDYRTDRWGSLTTSRRFDGKEEDAAVGLTFFGARYYHAALGRWISPDPLTVHGLGADHNPYAFVMGTPMGATDPAGLNCYGAERCDGEGEDPSDDDWIDYPPIDSGVGPGSQEGGSSPGVMRGPSGPPAPPPPAAILETLEHFAIGAAAFTLGALQGTVPGGMLTDIPIVGAELLDYKHRSPLIQYWQGAGQTIAGGASVVRGGLQLGGSMLADATGVGVVVGAPIGVVAAAQVANGAVAWNAGLLNMASASATLQANMQGAAPRPEKPFDPRGFRQKYKDWLKSIGKNPEMEHGWEVHHKLPQKYRTHAEFRDFDFDQPDNLAGVLGGRTTIKEFDIHSQITNEWKAFDAAHGGKPTRAQIMDFAASIDQKWGSTYWHNLPDAIPK